MSATPQARTISDQQSQQSIDQSNRPDLDQQSQQSIDQSNRPDLDQQAGVCADQNWAVAHAEFLASELGLEAQDFHDRIHRVIQETGDLSLDEIFLPDDEELDFVTLILAAERAGFDGDVLPDISGLPPDWVAAICRAWLDGRDQQREIDLILADRYFIVNPGR